MGTLAHWFQRSSVIVLALFACGFLGGCKTNWDDSDIEMLSLPKLREEIQLNQPDKLALLDSRPPQEFAVAHIAGAKCIDMADIDTRGKKDLDPRLSKYKVLVVYGNDPGSATARGLSKRLMAAGYSGVYMFEGGLAAWRNAGLPVEGTGKPAEAPGQVPASPTIPTGTTRQPTGAALSK